MTIEWDEESSMFDPLAHWVNGSEYYARTYRAEIPDDVPDSCIEQYIEWHPECVVTVT
jgi:hypothetical protein